MRSNHYDPDVAEALSLQIEQMINRRADEFTQGEILMACLAVIGSTLKSIQCRDCRKQAARSVKEWMPNVITGALAANGQAECQYRH